MKRRGLGFLVVLAVLLAVLFTNRAGAITLKAYTDQELAGHSVIVVARWTGQPLSDGRVFKFEGEARDFQTTSIEVQRAVKGGIEPGTYELAVGGYGRWLLDESGVVPNTSAEILGELPELRRYNLWFLDRIQPGEGGAESRPFVLKTDQGIQPLVLEVYFQALLSDHSDDAICKLLDSREPEVLTRCLVYVAGGKYPWPFGDLIYEPADTQKPRTPLRANVDAVAEVAAREDGEIRRLAAAVYAELAGADAIPQLRSWLSDKDPALRAIAVGCLARQGDAASAESFPRALAGLDDGMLGCEVVDAMKEWGAVPAIPALIALLQNDEIGGTWGGAPIPALRARAALESMLGFTFPTDVAASMAAWNEERPFATPEERKAQLIERLGDWSEPLAAKVIGNAGEPFVEVANRSEQKVVIARQPGYIELKYPSGSTSGSYPLSARPWPWTGEEGGEDPEPEPEPAMSVDSFVKLEPGQSITFPITIPADHFFTEPELRSVKVLFDRNGNEFGVNAWIGYLEAGYGVGWTEPDKTHEVHEEFWPNGKLKVRGTLINGVRHGSWTFWREDGKPDQRLDYYGGQVGGSVKYGD